VFALSQHFEEFIKVTPPSLVSVYAKTVNNAYLLSIDYYKMSGRPSAKDAAFEAMMFEKVSE
jgi:hypothetical protein